MYTVLEYYQWLKSDVGSVCSKYRIDSSVVLDDIKRRKDGPSDVDSLIYMDAGFRASVVDYVNKKCRPFLQKRDFLVNKFK